MTDALPSFAAIDFETANRSPRSAVALGVVVVTGGEIVVRYTTLLRPPTRRFAFSRIHGIEASDVVEAPDFAAVWPRVAPLLRSAQLLAAHNAAFDQAVLAACCAAARVSTPRKPFLCTMALSRATWHVVPTRLPDVCRRLEIPLTHHDAASDAEACASIVCAAWATEGGRAWIRRFTG